MTETLSTVVRTAFGTLLYGKQHAYMMAQEMAQAWGGPVGVWTRGGWYTVCDVAPELIEPQPELSGWVLDGVVDPRCERCDGLGYIVTCRADGEHCRRETCPACGAWEPPDEHTRERGDDDGVEYADPRDAREERDR